MNTSLSLTHPLVIGIAGGTASGKTSVTNKIVSALDSQRIAVIAHDSYYRDISSFPGETPETINFDHPNALETDLLVSHLKELRTGRKIQQPIYDFTTFRRARETRSLEPRDILIVEGILILGERELRDQMDIKIFIDTDADERLIRRIKRDVIERGRSVDAVMSQYVMTVKPMHLEFVEPSKHWADVIIPRGADNDVAIDMVVTKIRSLLAQKSGERFPADSTPIS